MPGHLPGPGLDSGVAARSPSAKGRGLRRVRTGGRRTAGPGFPRPAVAPRPCFVKSLGSRMRFHPVIEKMAPEAVGESRPGWPGYGFRLLGPGAGQQVDYLRVGSGSEVAVEEPDGPEPFGGGRRRAFVGRSGESLLPAAGATGTAITTRAAPARRATRQAARAVEPAATRRPRSPP